MKAKMLVSWSEDFIADLKLGALKNLCERTQKELEAVKELTDADMP